MDIHAEAVVLGGFVLNAVVVIAAQAATFGAMKQRLDDQDKRSQSNMVETRGAIRDVNARLGELVTLRECSAKHAAAVEAVEGMRRELDRAVKRSE